MDSKKKNNVFIPNGMLTNGDSMLKLNFFHISVLPIDTNKTVLL